MGAKAARLGARPQIASGGLTWLGERPESAWEHLIDPERSGSSRTGRSTKRAAATRRVAPAETD